MAAATWSGHGFAITVVLALRAGVLRQRRRGRGRAAPGTRPCGLQRGAARRAGASHATVFIAPDRPARVEPWLVSANRQAEDARPDAPSVQDSALREAVVQAKLSDPGCRPRADPGDLPRRAGLARPRPARLGHPLHRLLPAARAQPGAALARQRLAAEPGPVHPRRAHDPVPATRPARPPPSRQAWRRHHLSGFGQPSSP